MISSRRRKEAKAAKEAQNLLNAVQARNEKVSATDHEKRLMAVQSLYLKGFESRVIQQQLAVHYNVGERAVRFWILEMRKDLVALEGERDFVEERAKAKARLEALYVEASTSSPPNMKARIQINKMLTEMIPGGIAPQQVQLSGPDGGPVQVEQTDELSSRVAAILAKAKEG
jgi:hypothetical protein